MTEKATTILDAAGQPLALEAGEGQSYPDDTHPFWYEVVDGYSGKSTRATPTKIQKIATAYACVYVIAKTCTMLPVSPFRRLQNGGKAVAEDHPLYRVLHKRPNRLMDPFQFFQLKERSQLLYGNFYAQIIRNGRGDILELIPLHPERVEVVPLDGYEVGYLYRPETGSPRAFRREEIFHTKEPGEDGIVGRSRIQIASETFSLALSFLHHNKALFDNDSRPLGLLTMEHPTKDKEQKDKLRESWERVHKGPRSSERVAVLPFGVKYEQISMTARDAQLLELMQFSTVDQINTIFDVPPYRTQDYRRATFSNVEQSDINWGKNSIAPRVVATEKALEHQLLDFEQDRDIFVKFNMDAIFRADIKTRYAAHRMAILDGWMSRNEVRVIEDRNPADDPALDEFLQPRNMATPRQIEREQIEKETGDNVSEEKTVDQEQVQKEFSELLRGTLSALVHKEINALKRALKKKTFLKVTDEFYQKHREHMADTLTPILRSFSASLGNEFEPDNLSEFLGAYLENRLEEVLALKEKTNPEELFNIWESDHIDQLVITLLEKASNHDN